MIGNPFSVSSVCEGSRFVELGDGQGFTKKIQEFISLLDFITTQKHRVRPTLPRFLQKLCFDTKLAEKPNFFDFETIYGFCSSL